MQIEYKKEDILNKEAFLYYKNTYDFKELLSVNKKNILFIVGASWSSKIYPKEKFAKISNILEENILIAWGSEKEQKIAEYI